MTVDGGGDVESLWGKINPKDFGSRFERESAPINKIDHNTPNKINWNQTIGQRMEQLRRKKGNEFEFQLYRPKTRETQHAYELFLAFLRDSVLKDQPSDVVRNASDELLILLKNEITSDQGKKTQAEQILGPIGADQFTQLVTLARKLTDFEMPTQEDLQGKYTTEGEPSTEVAIVFTDEEEAEGMNVELESSEEESVSAEIGPIGTRASSIEELNLTEINSTWLQGIFTPHYLDSKIVQSMATKVLQVLQQETDERECENELVELLEFDKFDLINFLLKNRFEIVNCIQLSSCEDAEQRRLLETRLRTFSKGAELLHRLNAPKPIDSTMNRMEVDTKHDELHTIDLEKMAFSQGSHTMTNKRCKLPEKSYKVAHKGFEEIHIPAPQPEPIDPNEKLVSIQELPKYFQDSFKGSTHLNRVQSKVYPVAFGSDQNMLLCAPTGAGKTNVALLAMLRTIEQFMDPDSKRIRKDAFKLVYIAPMKALVQEIVGTMSMKLSSLGLTVAELTGDSHQTKQEISRSQLIVTTPEKWDVVTRKGNQRAYLRLVRLLVIDEVHLLHDERGPVIESLVARTLRSMEESQEPVRIVALSATLPNYLDVARFLRVDLESGVFFFSNSYRPCPLAQQYIGITEQKALKRFQLSNEIVYQKIVERAGKAQMIVFVHSRRETFNVAKIIKEACIERNTLGLFFSDNDLARREILRTEALNMKNANLQEIVPFGFAIHHAGLSRHDRKLVEDLFADGHVQILFSTATLAWGVNLPAHTVIVKGTQVFSPAQGKWTEVSPQDIMQMLGRAGRPQYDKEGEGIIVTSHQELQYYLSLFNMQLPIESQLLSKLVDNLNAEIVLGTITSRDEAVTWLGYTYLYVRMMREPSVYGVERTQHDTRLREKRADLVHSACGILHKHGLIQYDRRSGQLKSTELGRVASHFYISHRSMQTFQHHLRPFMSEIDLLRIFSLSDEFSLIPVRDEEKPELAKLYERLPIPIKEAFDDPAGKINILLQSYISRLNLEEFALNSDLVFVGQNAARLFRGLYEIALANGWAKVARKTLELAKMIQQRQWGSMSPLRQFSDFPSDLIKSLERRDFPFARMFELSPQELGELVRAPKHGHLMQSFLSKFPRLLLSATTLPLTAGTLKVDLLIEPAFEMTPGTSELFWIFVQDVDGDQLLHSDTFVLKEKRSSNQHSISFCLPLFDPMHPNYFVSVVSDQWIGSVASIPIRLDNMIISNKFALSTELLDLEPISVQELFSTSPSFASSYNFAHLNPIQTHVIHYLQKSSNLEDENIFIGATSRTGRMFFAEYLIQKRLENNDSDAKIVYISPNSHQLLFIQQDWSTKFNHSVVTLVSDQSLNFDLISANQIILSSVQCWEGMTKRWKSKRIFQSIKLVICDELQYLGSPIGPCYEALLTRSRIMNLTESNRHQLLLLSYPLANYRDIAEWMECGMMFNFAPTTQRPPLELVPVVLAGSHSDQLISMCKITFKQLMTSDSNKQTIILIPGKKLTLVAAEEYLSQALSNLESENVLMSDSLLQNCIEYGKFAFLVDSSSTTADVIQLWLSGKINFLLLSKDLIHELPPTVIADRLFVLGNEYFNCREHSFVDYSLLDLFQIFDKYQTTATFNCKKNKLSFYQKFLFDSVPVESHLHLMPVDFLLSEICSTRSVTNKQEAVELFSYSLLCKRLVHNPSYYGIQEQLEKGTVSEFLSELVENALSSLVDRHLSIPNEFDIEPLNLGLISSFYGISTSTVDMFHSELSHSNHAKTLKKRREILELLCSSTEFDFVQVGQGENEEMRELNEKVPYKFGSESDFYDPQIKVSLLIQCHLFRIPNGYNSNEILQLFFKLLLCLVDVCASNGQLKATLACMEMTQSVTQALLTNESPLLQIPHFTKQLVLKFKEQFEIETCYDLLEHSSLNQVILETIEPSFQKETFQFISRYPNVLLTHSYDNGLIRIQIDRELLPQSTTNEPSIPIVNSVNSLPRHESWWIVIGNESEDTLLSIKKISFAQSTKLQIPIQAELMDKECAPLQLYLISDCYLGCDQEFSIP